MACDAVGERQRGGGGDADGDGDVVEGAGRQVAGRPGEGASGAGEGVGPGLGDELRPAGEGVGETDGGRQAVADVADGDAVGEQAAGVDCRRAALGNGQVGEGGGRRGVAGVLGFGRAVERVAVGVVAVASLTVVGAPVIGGVGGEGVAPLHREVIRGAGAGGPGAAVAVGGVHDVVQAVGQRQHLAGVTEPAGAETAVPVGGDVAHRVVVGALDEVVAVRRNRAGQGDVQGVIVHQVPAFEGDGEAGGVVQFDPLVAVTGRRPAPGHFVDDDGKRRGGGRRLCRGMQAAEQGGGQQETGESGGGEPENPSVCRVHLNLRPKRLIQGWC